MHSLTTHRPRNALKANMPGTWKMPPLVKVYEALGAVATGACGSRTSVAHS